jgi:hypothetical protein
MSSVASARRIENWPYERLFKEADLVVIAQATSTEGCQDVTTANPWQAELLGQNTTFKVRAVLKGKPPHNTIQVLHFRLKDGLEFEDGPLLIAFRQEGIRLELRDGVAELGVCEYLLFLKAGKDGRFEPVSGRIDPALSVREVHGLLPSELASKSNN